MKPLRIHYLQHVAFEDLGCIEPWALTNKHQLSFTQFYKSAELPQIADFDWLIIMGGPMGVYDEAKHPWLKTEKEFIRSAIDAGKIVLGICLGAQLIANALGAKVYPNVCKEIGWFPISILPNERQLLGVEDSFTVFHWHGDTFELPENSLLLASSKACTNQAFIWNEKVLGLQFHFEVTERSLSQMVYFGKDELQIEKYIQSDTAILANKDLIEANNQKMYQLLAFLESRA